MSETAKKFSRNSPARTLTPRLFVLELNAGRIHSMNTDGSDRNTPSRTAACRMHRRRR